MMKEQQGRIIS